MPILYLFISVIIRIISRACGTYEQGERVRDNIYQTHGGILELIVFGDPRILKLKCVKRCGRHFKVERERIVALLFFENGADALAPHSFVDNAEQPERSAKAVSAKTKPAVGAGADTRKTQPCGTKS